MVAEVGEGGAEGEAEAEEVVLHRQKLVVGPGPLQRLQGAVEACLRWQACGSG